MILINVVAPNRMGMISHYSAVAVPIGVGMLAGYLLQKGKEVKILDEQIMPFERARQTIESLVKGMDKPYIFGLSCLTINIHRGIEIAKILKASYPDSRIIFGGIHATVLPEEVLSHSAVDVVVRGEGEQTLLCLYDAIKNNKGLACIEGISFKDGLRIVHTIDRPLERELDAVSFCPYHLFRGPKYSFEFVMTSRGCPFDCIFCSQRKISGRMYRFRSTGNVFREICLLAHTYRQRCISFLDDDFLVNKERVEELCGLIIRQKLHQTVSFSCQARADNINEDILRLLKEANFRNIGIGLETGSERLMRVINKKETVRENIRAVRLLKKMGLSPTALFMFGLPSETKRERLETYLLAKNLKVNYAKFNNIVPYPGTRLFEMAQNEGRMQIEAGWKNFNSVGSVVEGLFSKSKLPYIPVGSTERQLKKDLIRANLYFYLSQPSLLLSLLRRKNSGLFTITQEWYFSLSEYYYLVKLGVTVFINAILVFDLEWCVGEILSWLQGRKSGVNEAPSP